MASPKNVFLCAIDRAIPAEELFSKYVDMCLPVTLAILQQQLVSDAGWHF
jgi:hypothetical protein